MRLRISLPFLLILAAVLMPEAVQARQKNSMKYDTTLYRKLEWREIGPFRGGRSIAVAGHKDQPWTYYFGATGGGVWKTEDGGVTWLNVSDGFFKVGIVGALAVAESDPNVIYAGTGEACIRGNTMPGEGMYKSLDAGKTWKFVGLSEAQTISEIIVHPKNADLVYAAALGHVFGPNPERGVYRSTDGGTTWKKVLYKNTKTGAVDIVFDPLNPRIMYAALWEANRTPWSMSSGGPGSSLWKSADGGDTWTDISKNTGLPKGTLGKIGISASLAQADLVWALVESEKGGLFRSDDAGATWRRVNEDRNIRQRAWYYTHVYADPKNAETVYILNVSFHKSVDGGKTLTSIRVSHGDNHDLWIDPTDPSRMISGNDGGASVTNNGGKTWTEEDFATAQFYHVTVDNQFPYYVYGAQQDNSTVGIASRTTSFGIDRTDWSSVGGGESGYIAVNPADPNIIYAGSYGGYLTRYDRRLDDTRSINPWPENPMGAGAGDLNYRFQWTFPIVVSPHDPGTLYATANCVFRSTNEGMSWDVISPDLTRNDASKLVSSGGPITKDNTSVEYYGTIFTFAESPLQKGVLWSGSDDGVVQISRDGGITWQIVTPKDLPEWSRISLIDASPHDAGTAYLAAKRYQLDDFKPFIYKTSDYGKSWKKIVRGIPENEFVHAVREDPTVRGMLYCGTERGVYVSFDDGTTWQTLQLNLPVVPIHDLVVQKRESDLVVATHGRSFWIFDDLETLYQLNDKMAKSERHLFTPTPTYRMGGGSFSRPGATVGKNPANGVVVYYYFKNKPKAELKLDFLAADGSMIKSFSAKAGARENQEEEDSPRRAGGATRVPADSGMNRFVWDMRYPDATTTPGALLWGGTTRGPRAIPGNYRVRLTLESDTLAQPFEIRMDPRLHVNRSEYEEQFSFLMKVRDKVSAAHEAVNTIRDIRKQTEDLSKRVKDQPNEKVIKDAVKKLGGKLTAVEEEIIQTKIKSSQDALNYPIKLNNKLAALTGVVGDGDGKPTQQSYEVFQSLSALLDVQLAKYRDIIEKDLPAFNQTIKEQEVPAVILKPTTEDQEQSQQ
jgi:photosystem II stability/assembly factor-like uncharacterized protein